MGLFSLTIVRSRISGSSEVDVLEFKMQNVTKTSNVK